MDNPLKHDSRFYKMVHIIPEGEVGNFKIRHITVSKEASRFTMIQPRRDSYVAPGEYCQLLDHGAIVMSDTNHERRTNFQVVRYSKGDVLIAGLGIGMIVLPISEKEEVRSVTVIEKSPEVIELVEPHLRKAMTYPDKLIVVKADIFDWKPTQKYDTIYFDIWYNACVSNLKAISKLNRKYGKARTETSWRGAWVEDRLRKMKRSEKQNRYH